MATYYSPESLNEIAGGDAEFMVILAQTFLDEIPPDLDGLTVAIENDNKDLAYQFAHKMKPNLEMFGAGLEKDITTIESWTKTSKNKSNVADNLEHVQKTLHGMFAELKQDFKL